MVIKSYKKQPGFSLMEVVIVLFLTGLILLLVSKMIQQTLGSLKFLQEKAQTTESVELALETLSSELREAIKIKKTGDTLEFEKIDPSAAIALGYDLNLGDKKKADFWVRKDYQVSNDIGLVTYKPGTDENTLVRIASKGKNEPENKVASSIDGFMATQAPKINNKNTGNNVFQISLSIQEQRRIITFDTYVVAPGIKQ